jgi:hypothetical protein
MGRGPCIFKQRDITKAVRAVAAAGIGVARVEIARDGRIIVVAGQPQIEQAGAQGRNEWDDAS